MGTRGDGEGIEFAETLLGAMPSRAPGASAPVAVGGERFAAGRTIGEGGMGRVTEAVDRQFSRTVAVKQLRPGRASDAARERFTVEALVTANLEHPGIPPVYERGTLADGGPYYAMRLVRGRTLEAALSEAAGLDERLRFVPVLSKIAHTVAFAHERGVVHRDLKPENVVLGKHGEAIVLDWGIAKVRGLPTRDEGPSPVDDASRTGYGTVMGTPAYMAPELARGEIDRVDERTDVFALGAILYQILTGSSPYGDVKMADFMAAARDARFAPVTAREKRAPEPLARICRKAMARAPEDRYRSAVELAEALESLEVDALAGRGSGVRWAVNALFALLVVVAVVTLAEVSMKSATFREMGTGAYVLFTGAVVGALLGATEIVTRGRHRLSPLVLAVALGVLCGAVGTTAAGFDAVARAARSRLDDAETLKLMVAEGTHEAIGALALFANVSLVLLLLWGAGVRAAGRSAPSDRR